MTLVPADVTSTVEAETAAAAAPGTGDDQQEQQDEAVEESEAAIVFKLYELLRAADMEVKLC